MSVFTDVFDDIVADDEFAVEITYNRGEDSVSPSALVGVTDFEAVDEYGAVIRHHSRDYIVKTSDLVLSGAEILPARGDTIEETIGDYIFTFKVLDLPNEGLFRYDDMEHHLLRIHSILVTKEAASS